VLKSLRTALRKLELGWRYTKSDNDRALYTATKAFYHKEVARVRGQHLKDSLDSVSLPPKILWKVLNRSLGRVSPTIIPSRPDLSSLCSEFKTFFLNKPLQLHSSLQQFSDSGGGDNAPLTSFPSTASPLSEFQYVSYLHLSRILCGAPRKSSPQDPIPTWLLYRHVGVLMPAIHLLVNAAISDGMPPLYKHSTVTPLLKKKGSNPDDLGNYRPISNLSFLSKIIERVVFAQIIQHLESQSLLDSTQSAYRRHHSCETAVLAVINEALLAMDKKKVMLLVLLDLSAAFDSVNHHLLSY